MGLDITERKKAWGERFSTWTPIARLSTLLDSMSPRDRRLLILMICAVVILAIAGGTVQARNYQRRIEQEIERKEQQLVLVQQLSAKYQSLGRQIERRESELKDNPDFNLTSFLEQKATEIEMNDDTSLNSRGEVANEGFLEETVGVKLRKRSLVDVVRYLHAIEGAPQHLHVKSLRIRTAYGSKSELNVDIEVSVLAPQET